MEIDEVLMCSSVRFKTKPLFEKGGLAQQVRTGLINLHDFLLVVRLECVIEFQFLL